MIKKIDGTTIQSPSSITWGLIDVSSEDSGRTLDAKMHIDRIDQKMSFNCVWNGVTQIEASVLLKLVCSKVFIDLTYDDPITMLEKTGKFYTGDKSAPVHIWYAGEKMFESISFNFIEQ